MKRIPLTRTLPAATTHKHDHLNCYIADLSGVIDMEAIASAKLPRKTVVSSSMIDRVTARLARRLHEVPAGFE